MKPLQIVTSALEATRLDGWVGKWGTRRPGFIAVYHDIQSEILKRHLLALTNRFEVVPLDEIVNRLVKGLPTNGLMAITFDDGLRRVVQGAAELARDYNWAMTFYLPTRFIDSQNQPWYLILRPLIEGSPRKEIRLDAASMPIDSRANRERTIKWLTRRFMEFSSVEEADAYVGLLRGALYGPSDSAPDMTSEETVNWGEVKELARREEVTFGAHTVNHLPLARLDAKAIDWELRTSKERIESVTDRPAVHFCYPFGGLKDIGPVAIELARPIFASAVTMVRGRCDVGVDLALLPRIPFWGADEPEVARLRAAITR